MLDNIVHPKPYLVEDYRLSFEWPHTPGSGYGFECDKNGNVDLENMNPAALESLANCLFVFDINFVGIEDYSRVVEDPSHGICDCGRTVYLNYDYGHGIDCDCGRIYNLSGQELAPRSQWEDRWDDDSTQPYCVEFGYAGSDY